MRRLQHAAFTLVELLVALAIIGVLVALLLPAVQMARESARNVTCRNHLRQMGIAFQTHHAAQGAFPWGGFMHPNVYVAGQRVNGATARGFAWSVYLLPYLEQQGLYDRLDFDRLYSEGANDAAARTRLGLFVCPSSACQEPRETTVYASSGNAITQKRAAYGLSHYGGIYGEAIRWPGRTTALPNNPPRGTLLYSGALSENDVTDGLANTLLVAEDTQWADGQWISSLNVMEQSGGVNNPQQDNEIRSEHPGGANGLFGDAHVVFLGTGTALEILAAICTRAGEEPVGF